MQRHNKYLVITIWVATIAFIGAGFVGWGAYDMNTSRATSVAKVGNRDISVSEFQLAYANNYDYYNQKLGGTLTKESADKMGLDKIVLQNIINETLLLNFANDLGLIVIDSDIKDKLKNDKNFQINGVFDKNRYYTLLKNRQISAKEYENGLKKELLLNKLQAILKLPISKREQEVFTSSLFMQDKLMVGKVTIDPAEIQLKDEDIKKFWESTKNNYKTKKQYELETIKIGLNSGWIKDKELKSFWKNKKYNYKDKDGKILSFEDAKSRVSVDYKLKLSKKEALKTYLKFKKGETKATGKLVINDDDINFPVTKLRIANKNQVLKPIARTDGYLVVKLTNVLMPKVMKFEQAKPIVMQLFKAHELKNILEKRAKARLQLFNGVNLGFVTRDSVKKIEGLSDAQSSQFLNYIFDNKNAQGYKIFGNSAILYKVMEQKLLNNDKFQVYKSLITQSIQTNKANELNNNLIIKLRGLYKVEQYYKGKGQ
ncbi:MAG: peptidylprolyl isomerase [Campylobacteraceae bacterium]|nr:peptidylprolyl isomerase [Campylobacteraceae bacterium]